MSWTRKTLLDPKDMDDWRYSEERMLLRAAVFKALSHHLNDHCRTVYEFCHHWVSQGNKSTENIEEHFQDFLKFTLERSYALTNAEID